jgi:hypothetical protein
VRFSLRRTVAARSSKLFSLPGSAYVFDAILERDPRVRRTVALAGEQTLDDLSELLREEMGWDDPHLYSFWLNGEFWSGPETEYSAPFELEEGSAQSSEIPLGSLELSPGQRIAYLFDYGDDWRVKIVVRDVARELDEDLPHVLDRVGEAPPQYPQLEEDAE